MLRREAYHPLSFLNCACFRMCIYQFYDPVSIESIYSSGIYFNRIRRPVNFKRYATLDQTRYIYGNEN